MNQVENQNLKQKLSIIIPVFNETESLKELNARIIQAIFGLPFDYEIIYIDDGSADNSSNIISEVIELGPGIFFDELDIYILLK